jgi:hypothetical protein
MTMHRRFPAKVGRPSIPFERIQLAGTARQSGVGAKGKRAMAKWLVHPDRDVAWIMRENVKKNRLARMDTQWVKERGAA